MPAKPGPRGRVITWRRPAVEGLTNVNAFDNAAWTKNNVTISADTTNNPSGQLMADSVVEGSAVASAHSVTQVITLTSLTDAVTTRASVSAKQAGRTWIRFAIFNQSKFAWFNIGTGVVGTALGCTSSITAESNGFYRLELAWTITKSTAPEFDIMVTDSDWGGTINGNGTTAAYLCAASVTQ